MPLNKIWTRSIAATLLALALPALTLAGVSLNVSVNVAPPVLPVYDQPPIPGDGYIWTPGYWAYSNDSQDYYWVPGTWVLAPQPGYLWTPGFWGVEGAVFIWHAGYWGPHVGFYGGVNYGHGYGGEGYEGGYWQGGHMYYNRSVNNISNTHITNVYNKTVVNNVTVNRVSYNGGNGGVHARPTAADEAAARDRHVAVTPVQHQHEETARSNPQLRLAQNKGRPPIAATARAGEPAAQSPLPQNRTPPHPLAGHRPRNPSTNPPRMRRRPGRQPWPASIGAARGAPQDRHRTNRHRIRRRRRRIPLPSRGRHPNRIRRNLSRREVRRRQRHPNLLRSPRRSRIKNTPGAQQG